MPMIICCIETLQCAPKLLLWLQMPLLAFRSRCRPCQVASQLSQKNLCKSYGSCYAKVTDATAFKFG